MTSRKSIWAGMDRLEGKKEGSSYKNLEKEQKRQGYGSKSKALEAKKERSIPSHKELIFKKKSNGKERAIPYRDSE